MSKLLFNRQPLVLDPDLAEAIGLNEAIVLQQVHYWIEINRQTNRNFRDGKYWTYNSMKNWHENNFRFWSIDTVKRTFTSLERKGLLISGTYNKAKFDQTKWYSINYKALDALESAISPIGAKCPNPESQDAIINNGRMHQPIPETYTETYICNHPISSPLVKDQGEIETEKIRTESTPRNSIVIGQSNAAQASAPFTTPTAPPPSDSQWPTSNWRQPDRQSKTKDTDNQPPLQATGNQQPVKPAAPLGQYNDTVNKIKDQIEYDSLCDDDSINQNMLNEVVNVITSTVRTEFRDGFVSMGNERVKADDVKAVFLRLNREHVEGFLESFEMQTGKVAKIKPYIRAALYNNWQTEHHRVTNTVNHAMPEMARRRPRQ